MHSIVRAKYAGKRHVNRLYATQSLHRSAAGRLRHCSRLRAHEDCVQLVQIVSASGEAGDARRHANEWFWWWQCRQ
jgi:hypothetical protein